MSNLFALSLLSMSSIIICLVFYIFSLYLFIELILAISAKIGQEKCKAHLEGLNAKLAYLPVEEKQSRQLVCAEIREKEGNLSIRTSQWKKHLGRFIGTITIVMCIIGILVVAKTNSIKKQYETQYPSTSIQNDYWN